MISWKNPGPKIATSASTTIARPASCRPSRRRPRSPAPARCMPSAIAWAGRCSRSPPRRWRATHDDRLASLSFFAAQVDFTEAGELMLFINESQVAFLEDMMWERGYLDARQMAGAFQLLRSNDLIWSRIVHEYLMGERSTPIDIMAWNADATRMPYRMHSEYLRSLFLDNRSRRRSLRSRWPAGRASRHTRADLRGRHRAGSRRAVALGLQVLPPDRRRGHLRPDERRAQCGHPVRTGSPAIAISVSPRTRMETSYVDPDTWLSEYQPREGSWWPAWSAWLVARSGEPVPPPSLGDEAAGFAPLEDAPGRYVFMR